MRTIRILVIGLAFIMAAPVFAAKIPAAAKAGAAPVVAHKAGKSCAATKCSKAIGKCAHRLTTRKAAVK